MFDSEVMVAGVRDYARARGYNIKRGFKAQWFLNPITGSELGTLGGFQSMTGVIETLHLQPLVEELTPDDGPSFKTVADRAELLGYTTLQRSSGSQPIVLNNKDGGAEKRYFTDLKAAWSWLVKQPLVWRTVTYKDGVPISDGPRSSITFGEAIESLEAMRRARIIWMDDEPKKLTIDIPAGVTSITFKVKP